MKFYSLKTLRALAMTALVSAAMLTGCTRAAAPNPAAKTEAMESKKMLKVMASFYPMYDFAAKIGGDKAEVITLVPSGTEPHDWEPISGIWKKPICSSTAEPEWSTGWTMCWPA